MTAKRQASGLTYVFSLEYSLTCRANGLARPIYQNTMLIYAITGNTILRFQFFHIDVAIRKIRKTIRLPGALPLSLAFFP